MKRYVIIPVLVLLMGPMIFSAGCSWPPSQQTVECLGNIALNVAATLADGEEFAFGKLLSSASVCIDAIYSAFNSPSNSSSSSPEVDINAASQDSSFNSSVQSTPWGNCTDSTQQVQFNFYVPFAVIAGPQDNQQSFNASPTLAITGDALVAQKLFEQYSSQIASTTTNGPSQSNVYDIGPHTQVTFTLPVTVYYTYGDARLVNNGNTTIMPWFITDGYQQNGNITYTTSSC